MSSAESEIAGGTTAACKRTADIDDANGSDAKRPLIADDETFTDSRKNVGDNRHRAVVRSCKRVSTREVAAPNELSEQERSLLELYIEQQAELLDQLRDAETSERPEVETVFSGGRKCVVEELAVGKETAESYLALTVPMDFYGNGSFVPCTAVFKPKKKADKWEGMIFYMIDYGDPMTFSAISGGERFEPVVINELRRALMMPNTFDLEVVSDKHCEEVSELTDKEKKLLLAAVKHHRMDDDVVDSSTTVEMLLGNDDFMDDSMCQFFYFHEVPKAGEGDTAKRGRVYVRVGFGMGGSDHSTVFEGDDDAPLFTCVDTSDFGWAREGRGESKEDEELMRAFKYFISLQNQENYDGEEEEEEESDYLPPDGRVENDGEEDEEEEEEVGGDTDEEDDDDDDGAP